MRPRKSTAYRPDEIRRLYDRTEHLRDISSQMTQDRVVEFEVDDPLRLCGLPASLLGRLRAVAKRRRTTPRKLVERWVREKLAELP